MDEIAAVTRVLQSGWVGMGPETITFEQELAACVKAPYVVTVNSCTSALTQYAGLEALTGPQESVEKMRVAFQERRDVIVQGMNQIPGFHCLKPEGAFYVFPDITGTGKDSKWLADYILNDAGVACISGTSFGEYGEGFLRFSYANSMENLNKALLRIRDSVQKLQD